MPDSRHTGNKADGYFGDQTAIGQGARDAKYPLLVGVWPSLAMSGERQFFSRNGTSSLNGSYHRKT